MTGILQINWVRHLPVAVTGRYIGHTDIPAIIPKNLANLAVPLPENALWFSSPMLRTIDSAHWLMESVQENIAPLQVVPELMEQNFGVWENKTYEEVWKLSDKSQNWQSPAMVKPENGESFIGVCARVDHWIENMMKEVGGKPLIVVAHAGTIRAALRHALNIIPEQALSFAIDYGSITQVEYFLPYGSDSGGARVSYVNR